MLRELKVELDRLRARQQVLFPLDDEAKRSHLVPFYVRIMPKVVAAERCSVFVLNPKTNIVWLKAGTGMKESEIEVPKADSITGRVIETGEPIMESGLESKPGRHKEIEARTKFAPRSVMCVPIKSPSRDEVTGAMEVLNKVGASGFSEEDLAMAKEIAEHLQLEVDRIFLNQEIFGLTERLYSTARKSTVALLGTAVALFVLAVIIVLTYLLVPTMMS